MRILVTGSRDWPESRISIIISALKEHIIPNDTIVVHGACHTGADEFAFRYCMRNGILQEQHHANWAKLGKAAGPVRNQEMVDLGADLCLAFIYRNSRGASGTVELCRKAGIPLRIFELP